MFNFEDIRGKLVVSCQALPDEPLHSAFIMGRMARAAKEGGAAAIRAQSMADILEIREVTGLPVIGLVKRSYPDSAIYITPTHNEVAELLATGCEVIALDMTDRRRPGNEQMPDLVQQIHEAGRLVLADISTFSENPLCCRLPYYRQRVFFLVLAVLYLILIRLKPIHSLILHGCRTYSQSWLQRVISFLQIWLYCLLSA